MNSVEVRNVQKVYGKKEDKKIVLNGINLTVAPSSIYTLIGASGCGKTTLLSCILGMKSLDSGSIKVLDHKVSYNKTSKVGHLIGFMPQNTALIRELTVNETLNYFGNIFLMKKQDLIERSQMIQELLELPSDDREIQHLSGGQQRRVSLAAAIIHNPLILILDEPTVGLDSILREKIWKFLLKSTRESNLSIIITTHYISEAQQSDRCGMMRDGILLAEDSPKNILTDYEAQDLDEAFLKVCLLRRETCLDLNNNGESETVDCPSETHNNELIDNRKMFSSQTVRALIMKEFIRIKRQLGEFFFVLILPILQIIAFSYAIGGLPVGLRLGVVNNEVTNRSMCDFYLDEIASYRINDYECAFNYASCHLLNEIHDSDALKIYYDSYDKAYHDAKRGKLNGIVTVNQNISKILTKAFETSDEKLALGNFMDINMDQSNLQITTFLEIRLFQAYERFNKKLLNNCNYSEKLLSVPMDFSETINGSVESDFRTTMFPIVFLQSIMFLALGFASFSIGQSRIDGVWNRTLLAGVKPLELLVTQILFAIGVELIPIAETIATCYLTLTILIKGSTWLLAVFAFFACANGSLIGILLSVLTDDLKVLSMISFFFMIQISILSGFIWPLEAQPIILKQISQMLPLTLPSLSVRNIVIKGSGIEDSTVIIGLLVSLAWMIITFVLSYFVVKRKRFVDK